ncbi:hypothetical protein ANCCAN_03129 [Ancylostoma caninum]|uniref:Calcineurin-like phosphoesterase domain-containing protein n=1 Tax=Ancylostoma caninum TaxID=29170 RepID=A0A368H296_ANCCA|nr:hypothetical protein ANCCAN_03129 [Ancylostoma caninum]
MVWQTKDRNIHERGKDMRRGLIGTLALAIFGMAVIGSITTNFAEIEVEPAEVAVIENVPTDTLRLFLVGDAGGLPIYPYYSYAQKKVAKSMENMALEKKVQMVLNVGDNIYYTGVSNEYDSRFRVSFFKNLNVQANNFVGSVIAKTSKSTLVHNRSESRI